MTDTRTDTPSIAERTQLVAADAPVVGVHFLRHTAAYVLGEEALLFIARDGDERRITVHDGGILASAADASHIITGGDDGKVVETNGAGESKTVATDAQHRWIDHVAIGPDGAVAWSAGKQVFVRPGGKSDERALDLPSTAGALTFASKGFRLAIAHYNGATLWFPNAQAAPERLEWKGSHLGATFSPDGRFFITAMQEPMLHGWRLADRKDMRMAGYAARVRSLDWSADGKWLATSGADRVVLWPFQAKDGPMGKTPKLLAPAKANVEVVACHPSAQIVAAGYADGLILLVRIDDGAEILARKPTNTPVTALAWSADSAMLAFGTEDGDAGLIAL